jgi:hypothetical protein
MSADGSIRIGADPTPFRSFSDAAFHPTLSWSRLEHILTGNGGAYGIYGPRGSGKSWLMLKAISWAKNSRGTGLWFPCPSEYDTAAFLSSLSDNLASAIENRFIRNNFWSIFTRRLQFALSLVALLPAAIAVVAYAIHGLNNKLTSATIFSALPAWLWMLVGIAIGLLLALFVVQVVQAGRPSGRLAREATALRERIRFTTELKLGTELGVSGGGRLTGSAKRSHEKSLDERPTTIASLVFDFRKLAELIAATTKEPLVIGIDELDKIEDPQAVRKLLRDIKGIFEITGVYFLVSVSEEAATALRLGPLQGKGRNEFNSSFYTVLELPPLSPDEVTDVMRSRGIQVSASRAGLLCLLGAGNWREIVRLAESAGAAGTDFRLAAATLHAETAALQREIIRVYGGGGGGADQVIVDVWRALPSAAFDSPDEFGALSRTAIHGSWDLAQSDTTWQGALQEPWRRILIRLFVMGRVTEPSRVPGGTGSFSGQAISDLRDVLVIAGQSTTIALLMLKSRFGDDLAGAYVPPAGTPVKPGLSSRLLRGTITRRRG